MRIAVTGASGFIGRHAVRALRARCADVIAISRQPDAPLDAGVTPLNLDIANPGEGVFDRIGRPDALLHLAWNGLPHYRSTHHVETELPAHMAFLESCIRSGLRRVVVAGTCLEYGMQSGELAESAPTTPVTEYARAKVALHDHLQHLRLAHDFDLAWLRLFYLFGPGQAPTSLYSQLRAAVGSGATSFDMSPGDQVRDFLPVETATAHMAALALEHADAGVVNVCSGVPSTVIDVVQRWLHEWHASIDLRRGVYARPDYEPFAFWGNPGRLQALLGAT